MTAQDPDNRDPYQEAHHSQRRGEHARAIAIYEGLVKQGDVHALVLLGTVYVRGLGVPADLDRAEELFNRAVACGSEEAIFQLAGIWWDRGDMQRYFLAIRRAAELDVLAAQFYLGLCHAYGRGTARDDPRANELIHRAAQRGFIRAKNYLARRSLLRIYNPFSVLYGLIKMPLVFVEGLVIALIDPHDERIL